MTNTNKTVLAYEQIVNVFKKVNYKCIVHEDFLLTKPTVLFFDSKKETVYIAVNLGGDYKDEFLHRFKSR